MQVDKILEIANELTKARLVAGPVAQYSDALKDFSIPDAYSIQEEGIRLREKLGEKIIGLKMGLTSEAKRKQMDLDSPLYGVLTDKMEVDDSFSLAGTIHPKIEPEIFFKINRPLKGSVTREEVIDSIEWVGAALEILDSRYSMFKYFSMEDVISDNSSSSHFILGKTLKKADELNLSELNMSLKVDGKEIHNGSSKAISGDPVLSVVQLVSLLNERGTGIEAGAIVLAGAATPAVALEPGMKVELEVESLGNVEVSITN